MLASTVLQSILSALLGLSLSTAAPVPPPPRVPDKPAPTSWKLAELNALLPNPDEAGTVVILVWEVIDYEGFCPTLERCLVVKKYTKPKGVECALGYLMREPGEKDRNWKHSSLTYLSEGKSGELIVRKVDGAKSYKSLPNDEELSAFLKDHGWSSAVSETIGGRIEVGKPDVRFRITPKVTDGGICRADWKKVFDREPPAKLFPELTTPVEKK